MWRFRLAGARADAARKERACPFRSRREWSQCSHWPWDVSAEALPAPPATAAARGPGARGKAVRANRGAAMRAIMPWQRGCRKTAL